MSDADFAGQKGIGKYGIGQLLEVLATDPAAVRDFHFFGNQTGNIVIGESEDKGVFSIIVKRK